MNNQTQQCRVTELTLIAAIRKTVTSLDQDVRVFISTLNYDPQYSQSGRGMDYTQCETTFSSFESDYQPSKGEMLQLADLHTTYRQLIEWATEGELMDRLMDNQEEYDYREPDYPSIEGAVIVAWEWRQYVGYARNFIEVRRGEGGETEEALITGNEERTGRTNLSIVLTAKETEGLSDSELMERVTEELQSSNWKWDYFKKHPTANTIADGLGIHISSNLVI